MATLHTWYKDNSHTLTVTVTGSGSSAVVTGTLLDAAGATVWTGSLTTTGTADTYRATIDPASAIVAIGGRYTIRILATYSSRTLEFEDAVDVTDRGSA